MPASRQISPARKLKWSLAVILPAILLLQFLLPRSSLVEPSFLPALQVGRDLQARAYEKSELSAVEGWVVAQSDNRPVEGSRVAVGGICEASTDQQGYFSCSSEQLGMLIAPEADKVELDVTVEADGYAPWSLAGAVYYRGDTLRLYPRLASVEQGPVALSAARAREGRSGVAASIDDPAFSLNQAGNNQEPFSLEASSVSQALTPPASIRVYRTGTGVVEVVPFRDYVKHVLPLEWVPTWAQASLRSGAMAVKMYAWYWISRGGKQPALEADLKDNVDDQVYDPNVSYASTDAAVDATFNYALTMNGRLFQTQYCAGTYSPEASGACPWNGTYMTQWGSAYHADQGRSWGWILQYYYSGSTITPNPPGGGYDGTPPPRSTPAPPGPTPLPASYSIGQGATRPELFVEAYNRNGGAAILGNPTGPVRWWLQYMSEYNVVAQPFSGPTGRGNVWIVFDVLKSPSQGVYKAFVLAGDIGSAYSSNTPPGPEWVGAPTSDPYIAPGDSGGITSQGFTRGTLVKAGSSVQFVPWPQQFAGWRAEYFVGRDTAAPAGIALPGQPALVRDVVSPDFDWTATPDTPQSLGVGKVDWSAQFTRDISVAAGRYSFTLAADGRVRLWIGERLVIDAWQERNELGTFKHDADLVNGSHSIRIQYSRATGGGRLQFAFAPQSGGVEARGGQPPTSTGNAALRVKVQWLGRGLSPSDRWALPLTLSLSSPGDARVLGKYQGTSDRNGVAFFNGLPVGTYNVHVKGPHNLQSARAAVSLSANSTADVDMKAQVDGDVDGDNCVTVNDFATVQGMLGGHRDMPGFLPEADLNGDGIVSMTDVSLLRSGFELCGDVSADNQFRAMSATSAPMLSQALAPWTNPAALQHTLALSILPASPNVKAGETFEVSVLLEAGNQTVDGASFVLRYDAARFTPVDASGGTATRVEPGHTLPAVMGNWVDAQGGAIGYAAGMLQGEAPMGTIVLARAKFRALPNVGSGPALFTFDQVNSPVMQITNGGENLLARVNEAVIMVNP